MFRLAADARAGIESPNSCPKDWGQFTSLVDHAHVQHHRRLVGDGTMRASAGPRSEECLPYSPENQPLITLWDDDSHQQGVHP